VGELIVITGPPGAGKSTVAALLAADYQPSALVAGDAFFGFLARGAVDPWLPAAAVQNETVTEAAALAAGRLAHGGFTVVFDGVVGPWLLPTFAAATGLSRLHYAVLLPSEEICLQRVRDRVGHGFTDPAATRHMHADFARAEVEARHRIPLASRAEVTATRIRDLVADGSLGYPAPYPQGYRGGGDVRNQRGGDGRGTDHGERGR
jgi:predicted ABC-type ATPase